MPNTGEGLVSVARARPRGRTEMAALYAEVFPGTLRLAYLLCGDRDAAGDLAQEAFVKGYARVANLADRPAVEAYLRRTVVNLVRGRGRKKRIERSYAHLVAQREDAAAVEARDEALWNALRRLPARQRAALVLRYYLDLSEQQTADTMACSAAAVKSMTARGMRSLRQILEGADDGES